MTCNAQEGPSANGLDCCILVCARSHQNCVKSSIQVLALLHDSRRLGMHNIMQRFGSREQGIRGIELEAMENINLVEREWWERCCSIRTKASLGVENLVNKLVQCLCKKRPHRVALLM
jgi:hypothetical protein